MSDLINRQAAIDAIYQALYQHDEEYDDRSSYGVILDAEKNLKQLQSAEPKRERGGWIRLYKDNYKCSVCGSWWQNENDIAEDFKFCPNCGSFNGGEEE